MLQSSPLSLHILSQWSIGSNILWKEWFHPRRQSPLRWQPPIKSVHSHYLRVWEKCMGIVNLYPYVGMDFQEIMYFLHSIGEGWGPVRNYSYTNFWIFCILFFVCMLRLHDMIMVLMINLLHVCMYWYCCTSEGGTNACNSTPRKRTEVEASSWWWGWTRGHV